MTQIPHVHQQCDSHAAGMTESQPCRVRAFASTHARNRRACEAGFTLLEVSISLGVSAVLAGVAIGVIGAAQDLQRAETRSMQVQQARAAIFQFARANFRLPCPDLTGSGFEGDASGRCTLPGNFGGLPFRTLGLEPRLAATGIASANLARETMRYGVFRNAAAADLSAPQATFNHWPARERLTRLAMAAISASAQDQPFIPALSAADASQADCDAVGSSPAFVISIGPSDQLGSGTCFAVPAKGVGAFTAASRAELAGWTDHSGE